MANITNEKGFSRAGSFFIGFFLGMLVCVIIVIAALKYVISNPQPVIIKAVDLGATRLIEKTVETIPKEYVVVHQNDINQSVMKVTQAYAEGRLTSSDIQSMGREVFQLIADQEITSDEIDRMIRLINRIVE